MNLSRFVSATKVEVSGADIVAHPPGDFQSLPSARYMLLTLMSSTFSSRQPLVSSKATTSLQQPILHLTVLHLSHELRYLDQFVGFL